MNLSTDDEEETWSVDQREDSSQNHRTVVPSAKSNDAMSPENNF